MNYYEILGVMRSSTTAEVESAYHDLIRIWRAEPRKTPELQAQFVRIHEAYFILRDVAKRAAYDRLLSFDEGKALDQAMLSYSQGSEAIYYFDEDVRGDWEDLVDWMGRAKNEASGLLKEAIDGALVGVFSWIHDYGRLIFVLIMVIYFIFALSLD